MSDKRTAFMWSDGNCFQLSDVKPLNPDLQEAARQREAIRQAVALDEKRRADEEAKSREQRAARQREII